MPNLAARNHSDDFSFLRRALELAQKGFGLASPNPHVGAVIVDAEGNSRRRRLSHLRLASSTPKFWPSSRPGRKRADATLYINLEPCSHHGPHRPMCGRRDRRRNQARRGLHARSQS